jgi:hypothetical protein
MLYVVPRYDDIVLTLLALELDLLALGRRLVLDPLLLNPGVASVFHNLLLYPGKEAWFQAFTRTLQARVLVDYPNTILHTKILRGGGLAGRMHTSASYPHNPPSSPP